MTEETQRLYSLREATKHLPVPRGYQTISRWIREGVRTLDGRTVKLKTFYIGKVRYVQIADIYDFLKEINQGRELDR